MRSSCCRHLFSLSVGRAGGVLLAALCVGALGASARAASPTTDTLSVRISLISPFVMEEPASSGAAYGGFSVDYWRAIAEDLGLDYRFTCVPFDEVLAAVHRGEADVGVGAVSITSARESGGFDFSHPYFHSGLGILTRRSDDAALFSTVSSAFFTGATSKVLLFLLFYIVLTAHVIWLCEKGQDAFDDKYFPGVPQGAWWTIVTMSTVGYGDMVPNKWLGKFCAVVTIFVGIGVFGWVLSQLTAVSVTEWNSDIRSASDLKGRTVAVKKGTTSLAAARKHGARIEQFAQLDDAYALLAKGKVDAVVHDWPVLSYYALSRNDNALIVVGEMFDKQDYGFIFREGSPLREKVNQAHLRLVESGVQEELHRKYFEGSGP